MEKLGKKFQRELIKSPGKSALLGLVCLVALWYWAPILCGWLTGAPDTPPDIRVVKPTVPGTTDSGLVADAKKVVSSICDWRTLTKWMDDDPATGPAVLPEDQRDPFGRPRASVSEKLIQQIQDEIDGELTVEPKTTGGDEPDISDLKLVLSGTIFGTRFRSATINGSSYQEGDVVRIPVGTDSEATDAATGKAIELELVEVQPSHVVLKRGGKKHLLQLELGGLAFGDRIVRRVTAEKINASTVNE